MLAREVAFSHVTGGVTLQPGQRNARLNSKGVETRQLTRVGRVTSPGVFTRGKVKPACQGNPGIQMG